MKNVCKRKKEKNKQIKTVKILISEQIALAAMFYFEQDFAFCMLINKNVLEWFLLIICKEHALYRCANLSSRNHLTLCFCLIRESRQMPNTEKFYQTDKSSYRKLLFNEESSSEKILQCSQENTCAGASSFFNFIKKRLRNKCFTVAKFLRAPILKNIWLRLLLN